MEVLPKSASVFSFIIVTITGTAITFFLIANLKNTQRLLYRGYRGGAAKMYRMMEEDMDPMWNQRGYALKQADNNNRVRNTVSKWWYLGFVMHKAKGLFKLQGKKDGSGGSAAV
jgi:hypothetical protein